MMKVKTTYRFISAVLCMTMVIGMISPVLGHSVMMKHCTTSTSHDSTTSDHDHMKMNESMKMDSQMMNLPSSEAKSRLNSCEMSIDCLCEFTHSAVKTEALVISKVKLPSIIFTEIINDLKKDLIEYLPPLIEFSNAYSPPHLFLANQSFLI